MPWQLIYTSAPRGLLSGQSGFCTVARNADLREALVQRLEQLSSYHYLRVAKAATAGQNPTISAFRALDLRGAKYFVLTRIQPCGLDFTARTNHLAHHLIFQPDELANLPSPAAILRHWPGWVTSWQGDPRFLEELDMASFATAAKDFLPARTWSQLTGDAGRAAGLLESECVRGCYLLCPPGSEEKVLAMYGETLQLLNFNGQFPLRPWRHTFTTFLQAEDNPNDFQWRGCQENTPAYTQALARSARMLPLQSVRVPANDLVKKAREEVKRTPAPKPAAEAASPSTDSPAKPALTLRREPPRQHIHVPTPMMQSAQPKKSPPAGSPGWWRLHSAMLLRVGVPVLVLTVLVVLKYHAEFHSAAQGHAANGTPEQGSPAPPPAPRQPDPSEPPPIVPPSRKAVVEARALNALVGDGTTYVLAVPNLNQFSLPIENISAMQNLLHRYDRQDQGSLPDDIKLEVNTEHWDFPAGSRMKVEGRKGAHFDATLGGARCSFDYSDWLDRKGNALAVQTSIPGATHAFSVHFGFSAPGNGDPFRLLIVNSNNPPKPLPLDVAFLQDDHQRLRASLEGPLRECVLTNFQLLGGWQWQIQALTRVEPDTTDSRLLYKNWPPGLFPTADLELAFGKFRQELVARQKGWQKELGNLSETLGVPLGQYLQATNSNLASFLTYSQGIPTRRKFAEYLRDLKETSPDESWIRKWSAVDPDQLDEVTGKFRKLYLLWSENSPVDQRNLTVTMKIEEQQVETNYFFAAWYQLKEMEAKQERLAQVNAAIEELNHACLALCLVDASNTKQTKPGLEMIRFEGP